MNWSLQSCFDSVYWKKIVKTNHVALMDFVIFYVNFYGQVFGLDPSHLLIWVQFQSVCEFQFPVSSQVDVRNVALWNKNKELVFFAAKNWDWELAVYSFFLTNLIWILTQRVSWWNKPLFQTIKYTTDYRRTVDYTSFLVSCQTWN